MNIILTRPLIEIEDLMGKLFTMGHKIIHIPTLKISSNHNKNIPLRPGSRIFQHFQMFSIVSEVEWL